MPAAPKPPLAAKICWAPATTWKPAKLQQTLRPRPVKKRLQESRKNPAKPVMEDWSLVRTESNQVGWVLSHNLMMSIPDEVAQYANGKHITSYFDLGAVNDEKRGQKHNWLWTTASELQNFDFDSWRVFLWNRRRHRYETSYRQRDLEGYFPVEVDPIGSYRPRPQF